MSINTFIKSYDCKTIFVSLEFYTSPCRKRYFTNITTISLELITCRKKSKSSNLLQISIKCTLGKLICLFKYCHFRVPSTPWGTAYIAQEINSSILSKHTLKEEPVPFYDYTFDQHLH